VCAREILSDVMGLPKVPFINGRPNFAAPRCPSGGGMDVSDAKCLKSLEDENRRLKSLLAEAHLDISMLKDVASKKW